jgi:type VI secretion system secreted protein VgrG
MLEQIAAIAANQSHFELDIQGLAPGALSVTGFSSADHALSQDYRLSIQVVSRIGMNLDQLLGAPATLALRWAGDRRRVHGLITHLTQMGDSPEGPTFGVVLASPLAPLKQSRHSRVFLNKTVLEIVSELLKANGFSDDDFALEAKAQYPAREFVAQYEESDYDFLCRQLAYHGLFFAFAQREQRAVLLVADELESLAETLGAVPLSFHAQSGQTRSSETVFALRRRLDVLTASVALKDYNEQAPERPLWIERGSARNLPARGSDYRFGEHYGDEEEGARLAQLRQQALDWQRETVIAETDCRGLQPGMRLSLSRHPEPGMNGDWLVLEVEQQGDQASGLAFGPQTKGLTYRGTLLLLRAGVAYRTPYEPLRRSVYANFAAKIEGDGGEYAYLDEHGRYRLRLPWDLGEAPEGQASHPVRLMQPYGGERHGLHFPLHAGAEVAVGFVNGDIDRPIILGAVSNSHDLSPVTAQNPSQNILRTWGGNELLMEDKAGEERIELFTRERQNILTLDAKADAHEVRLASEQGEMELYAGKSMLIEVGESQTIQVGADHEVTVEGAQRLMTKAGEIEIEAATDLLLKAGENVRLGAEAANVEIRAEQDLIVETGADVSLAVRNQNATILVEQGDFSLQAKGAISFRGEGGGVIHIGQAGGSIEISDSGDLTIDAPQVEINGGAIAIKGQSVGNNA